MNRQEPTRLTILLKILECFQSIIEWGNSLDQYEAQNKYSNKAESLIELLEVLDCGSIGGYDKATLKIANLNNSNRPFLNRFERFILVWIKYNTIKELKSLDDSGILYQIKSLTKNKSIIKLIKEN